MIWSGLGANLSNTGDMTADNYSAELTILHKYTNKVRIHLPDYQSQIAIDRDMGLCQAAIDIGFSKIIWGISSNKYNNASWLITRRNWPTFRQKIIDYAAIAQNIGITEYQIGNEEELHIYANPTTMSRASNIVTAVLSFSPDYQVGDTIYVESATPSTFNGTFTLTGVSGATLTWAQIAANTSATGSKVTDFLKSDLRTNLRGVVAEVKAVFTGIVSTAVSQDDYSGWVSDADMGTFDFLTYNIYGENSITTFTNQVQAMLTAFPNKIKISEFAMHSNWLLSTAKGLTTTKKGFDKAYADEILNRIRVLQNLGITEAYMFTWQDSNDLWAIRLRDGGYRSLIRAFNGGRRSYAVADY